MKKGYWMAMVDITDPDAYPKYVAANKAAFDKYNAKFLVRGGQSTRPEGPAGSRHVIIEFDSYDTALACYNSPEYQYALTLRQAASEARIAIIEGV